MPHDEVGKKIALMSRSLVEAHSRATCEWYVLRQETFRKSNPKVSEDWYRVKSAFSSRVGKIASKSG